MRAAACLSTSSNHDRGVPGQVRGRNRFVTSSLKQANLRPQLMSDASVESSGDSG
jgi:hypothetical protein